MLESLRSIAGPQFLLIFFIVAVLSIVIARKLLNADGSEAAGIPDFARYDAISLALLKGGVNQVLRTAVFKLVERKAVTISEDGSGIKAAQENVSGLSTVESEVLRYLRGGTVSKPEHLFSSVELKDSIERLLQPVREEFERTGLIRSEEAAMQAMKKKWGIFLLVLALGLAKLSLGIIYDKPVFFLVFLMIGFIPLYLILVRVHPMTPLGRRYLEGLDKHFAWMQADLAQGKQPAGIDPAMVVALFGATALLGYAPYQAYAAMFPTRYADGGSSSGCSGTTGCSGSSGGSDGGGGGCGGCGGGGGGD